MIAYRRGTGLSRILFPAKRLPLKQCFKKATLTSAGRPGQQPDVRNAAVVSTRVAKSRCYASSLLQANQAPTSNNSDETRSIVLDVDGMKCGGCSAAVKRILLTNQGVQGAAVNLLTECAVIQLDPTDRETTAESLATSLTAKGFPAKLRADEEGLDTQSQRADEKRAAELQQSLIDLGVAWTLALLCCTHHVGHWFHALGYHGIAHGAFMHFMSNPWISGALGGFALLGPGRNLIRDGAVSLFRGTPNMNSLVGLGAVTSFAAGLSAPLVPGAGLEVSFLEEPVMLLSFVLLGRALEARARLKASADLRSLAKLVPARTRLLLDPTGKVQHGEADGAELEAVSVETSSVRKGDILKVLPGERIPVDGDIVHGRCSVDESMLTGESRLVPKSSQSQVTAGTMNYEGPIIVKATSTGSDSTIAGIGRLVSSAQAREAPIQRLADSVSGNFCYGVMTASALTFAFWTSIGAGMFPTAMQTAGVAGATFLGLKLAVNVLVVACPCALGLATPTAVLVASSMAAKRGLLLRGGDVLERLAEIDTIVFDKTGTLTQGKMQLVQSASLGNISDSDLLRVAASVEAATRHPLADSVARAAKQQGISVPVSSDANTEPGSGVHALVEGREVSIGKRDWVAERSGGEVSTSGRTSDEPEAGTVVYVGIKGDGIVGYLAFEDALRPDAADVVGRLEKLGIKSMLLSGDRSSAVTSMASQAGIAESSAVGDMTPKGKAEFVYGLRREGRKVSMVGDGINDAPALAASDAGMAFKSGLDVAGEAASVILMSDRLGQVVEAVVLGRATLAKIRQNLGWALAYNTISIPIAAGALLPAYGIALNPSLSGAAMAFSSIAVLLNSLLLRGGPAGPSSAAPRTDHTGPEAAHRPPALDSKGTPARSF